MCGIAEEHGRPISFLMIATLLHRVESRESGPAGHSCFWVLGTGPMERVLVGLTRCLGGPGLSRVGRFVPPNVYGRGGGGSSGSRSMRAHRALAVAPAYDLLTGPATAVYRIPSFCPGS